MQPACKALLCRPGPSICLGPQMSGLVPGCPLSFFSLSTPSPRGLLPCGFVKYRLNNKVTAVFCFVFKKISKTLTVFEYLLLCRKGLGRLKGFRKAYLVALSLWPLTHIYFRALFSEPAGAEADSEIVDEDMVAAGWVLGFLGQGSLQSYCTEPPRPFPQASTVPALTEVSQLWVAGRISQMVHVCY